MSSSRIAKPIALGALAGIVILTIAGSSWAYVQTVVESGVSRLVDNSPNIADPAIIWATAPACNPAGLQTVGNPGDELQPALISRASTSIHTPRAIFSFNPSRPAGVCNPYRLLSNIWTDGTDLYFVDNQGPDGHAALERLSRDANPGDTPRLLADFGTLNRGASLLVFDVSVIVILGEDTHDRLVQYHKDTGELLSGQTELADPGTLANLRFDGRFLYWTNRGALRRNDTTNGEVVTVANGPIDSLYTYGVDEGDTPDGHFVYSRVLYGQGNTLYEAETLSGQTFTIYTSPVATARITGIAFAQSDYFFIERRPIGGGFDTDERIFRLLLGNTVPDLIYGPVRSGGLRLDSFHTDYTWLYFRDAADDSLLRVPNDETAIPVRSFRATGLEVTQGLQDTANHLRLIADKRTIVRFYVRSELPEDVYGVTASLSGSTQNGFLGTLQPINSGGKLITVRPNPTRTNLDHSFQFELPRNWTTGGRLSLVATVNPFERIVEDTVADNSAALDLDFTANDHLTVVYFNFSYDLDGARLTPAAADVTASRLRMRQLYPLGEPGDGLSSPGLHTAVLDVVDNNLTNQVDRSDPACVKRYEKAADRNMCASDYVHARLALIKKSVSTRLPGDAVFYGNIAQAPAPKAESYFTRGYASGQIGSGPSTDTNYAAHEVGHTLGRQHPSRGATKCGHSASDGNYPYVDAFIARLSEDPETRFSGLNFGDPSGTMTFLNPNTQYDTMAYCRPNWISDYTFEGMYQYLISPTRPRAAALQRGAIAGDWLIVSGTITPAENAGGFTIVQRTNSVTDTTPPPEGSFAFELRNSAGGLLAAYPFAGTEVEEQPGKLAFDFVVAFIPGTAELRVVDSGTGSVLATEEVSANPPLVSDVQLPGAPNPVDGIVTVSWNAVDPDGDPLFFDIFASRDGDPTYRPIHLGIKETSIALDTAMLGGGSNKLRVVASDGAQTAYAESAPFTVPARKPKIVITSPVDGSRPDWGQLISLQAEVDDVQDESVEQVSWSSDKAGPIGSGRWVQTDRLPVGENVLTVTARNSVGESATATVTVVVGDVLAPPGPTLAVAPQLIAWHVAGDDSTMQTTMLTVDNHGTGTLEFDIASDAEWVSIDSSSAVTGASAPRTFTVSASPMMVPTGVTSHATLTVRNAADPSDTIVIPVQLSRGNVFDHAGQHTACVGDCDGDGSVLIAELIRAVNIALGNTPIGDCPAIDANDDGQAVINELVLAVNAALQGC